MNPVLRIEGLHVGYGQIRVVRGIDLEVNEGQVVAVIGANGAGKTTLMKSISGLLTPAAGKIYFRDEVISGKKPHQVTRKGIVHVPEGRGILAQMTVLENLKMGAYLRGDQAEVRRDFEMVFERFPWLMERLSQLAGTLSGGQQQMLAIARGLMGRPRILMMDEPSLGLAPIIVAEIFRIIGQLKQEGRTVLLVEQNTREALKIADYGYVIELGRIVMEGSAQDLLRSDEVVKAFLGRGTE